MRFRVLGSLEVTAPDGSWRAIASPNQRRVLAALLAHAGDTVSVDALIDAVWGDQPPETAVTTLRTYLSRLRPHLHGALVARGSGYRLDIDPDDIDAGRFEALVRASEDLDPPRAVAALDEALALWRGAAYGDEADGPAVRAEARRLDERRASACEAHAAALLAAGRAADAAAAAEALVAAAPLRERCWEILMGALAAAGRPAEAVRAFTRAASALAEVGLEPSAALRRAERDVLDGTPAPARPPAPAPAPAMQPAVQRTPAPVPVSSFVGRDGDCARLADLLDDVRVVTLVGPGGVGKTRLALEVAKVAGPRRALGTAMVDLAPLERGDAVPAAVAAALCLAVDSGSERYLEGAGHLDLLVVVDNAEHVIDHAARAVGRLVGGGVAVRVLVTSREPLGVEGEHVWTVHPLPTEGPDAAAVRLFVDRARAVAPDAVADATHEVVQRVVGRLDGLPLAIEMAAAQLASADLTEVADVLDRPVTTLRWRRRDVAPRHRSLANVLAWSESRLTPGDAATLAGLSVFAGSVTASDIVGVLGDEEAADVARTLVERSLVVLDRGSSPACYRLLHTIRRFAAERLVQSGRHGELARRHAVWFLDQARTADAELRTPDERHGHDRMTAITDELRAAHAWATRHDVATAAALSAHLHLFAQSRLLDEPLRWAEALLDVLPPDDRHRPVVLASAATRAINRGDLVRGRHLATQACEQAGDAPMAMAALEALSDAAVYDGHLEQGIEVSRRLAALADEAGDRYYAAMGRIGELMACSYAGHGGAQLDEALAAIDTTALGPTARGWTAYARGELLAERRPAVALRAFEEAVDLARSVGNRFVEGVALVSACSLGARAGDLGNAARSFAAVIRHWDHLADHTHQLTTLRNLVTLFERAGAAEDAAVLIGAVQRQDIPTYGDEAQRLDASRAWATAQLGPDRFAQLSACGAALDVPEAARCALELVAALEQRLERSNRR